MSALMSLSWQNARANRSRFGLTALAVTLSVAFLTATLILADSITGTAATDIDDANAGLTFVVEGSVIAEGEGGPGEALERVTAALPFHSAGTIASLDGVETAQGVTLGFAKLVDDGEAVGTGTAADVGRTWISDGDLNPFALTDGVPPVAAAEVVLDRALARAGGVGVGDTVDVLTATGVHEMSVTGLATFGGADRAPLARTVLFAEDHAAELMAETGFARIRVATEPNVSVGDVMASATASLDDVTALERSEFVTLEQNAVTSPLEFLSIFLIAFAVVALIAGIAIIVNTFTIAIAQRRREFALMRAVGVRRREVLAVVVGESLLIAIASTAAGLAAGVAGAGGLRWSMNLAGLSFLDGPLVVSPATLAIGAAIGVVVTIGSAWSPARAASTTSPVEALTASTTEAARTSRWRLTGGGVALAVGVAGLGAAVATGNSAMLAAAAFLLPGVVLAGPAMVQATSRVTAPALSRVAHVHGRLASTNLTRNSRRSASTALGLTLGVALVGFFAIVASSLSATATSAAADGLRSDIVINSASPEVATIDPELSDRLARIDGVDSTSLATADGSVVGVGGEAVVGGVGPDIASFFEFDVIEGSLDDLDPSSVAVYDGVEGTVPSIGDELSIELENGVLEVEVVALFSRQLPGFDAPTHLVDRDTLGTAQAGLLDTNLFVTVSGDEAAADVRSTVAATPGSLFETRSSFASSVGSEIDAIRNLVYALLSLTVVIALVGVANTATLSIAERTREIGLLRAIGTSPRGVRRIIRYETAVLSAIGASLGLAIAVGSGWALVESAGGADISSVSIPWRTLVPLGVIAVALGIAAASIPAWRASRQPALESIASS